MNVVNYLITQRIRCDSWNQINIFILLSFPFDSLSYISTNVSLRCRRIVRHIADSFVSQLQPNQQLEKELANIFPSLGIKLPPSAKRVSQFSSKFLVWESPQKSLLIFLRSFLLYFLHTKTKG